VSVGLGACGPQRRSWAGTPSKRIAGECAAHQARFTSSSSAGYAASVLTIPTEVHCYVPRYIANRKDVRRLGTIAIAAGTVVTLPALGRALPPIGLMGGGLLFGSGWMAMGLDAARRDRNAVRARPSDA
jgi:hypothetical protein